MISKRQIREAVIQFLYFNQLEDGAPPHLAQDAFWELVLEDDFTKLTKASIKTILHLNQGRKKRFEKFLNRVTETLPHLDADPNAKKLSMALHAVLKSENKWQSIVDRLQRLYQPSSQEINSDTSDALSELYLLNHTLIDQRKKWFELVTDFPQLQALNNQLELPISELAKISDRVYMVEHPTKFPDQRDIKHLIETKGKMHSYKEKVDELIHLITKNKDTIDSHIHNVVENYKPERIDPVDRAIMRLGVAEILYIEDIPHAVSINEAIEIANIYGSSDSSKFINGILDKIAKNKV